MRKILAALGKIGILGLILIAFAFGLAGTVYLSLRSPNVTVPDVTSKTLGEGETSLEATGLNIRERAKRYKSDVKPGVILDQFPRGGEVVKQGQTVAVIVSRAPKEGESAPTDEIVETEEEKTQGANASPNGNQNRERRRGGNTNRGANSGGNASPNSNNQNAGGNQNAASNGNANSNRTPTLNTNRNANGRPSNGNANDRSGRNANNRNANSGGNRNANTGRNANAARNTNRRPD